jgi:hypothetical protein
LPSACGACDELCRKREAPSLREGAGFLIRVDRWILLCELALGFVPEPVLLPFRLPCCLPKQMSALTYLFFGRILHPVLHHRNAYGLRLIYGR